MDLKTITATLALLGSTTMSGCGEGQKAVKTETKTETKVEVKEVTPAKTEAKEVTPAKTEAEEKGEMKCAEGKCGGEGACGGKKTEGDGKAVPVDAAKAEDAAAKPAEKPAEKS